MGLSNFPSPGEGMLPVLVMNTVISVTLLKNLLKTVHKFIASPQYWNWVSFFFSSSSSSRSVSEAEEEQQEEVEQEAHPSSSLPAGSSISSAPPKSQKRVVSIAHFKSLTRNDWFGLEECSVCLCRFEEEEEVSELSCKHFFHRHCLDNWFHNQHSTCPLCRSTT